jgi:hypothetical protein
MVFWWTNRGYLALLTLIGVYGLFGAVLTLMFGEAIFDQLPWLWGVAALLSAVMTWYVGSNINGRSLKWPRRRAIKDRLIYPARNRFVSLPVETWAAPMTVLGVFLVIRGVALDLIWVHARLTHAPMTLP